MKQCMACSSQVLLESGAKHVVIANVPPLDLSPAVLAAAYPSKTKLLKALVLKYVIL